VTGVARVAAPRCIRQFGRTDTVCIDKKSSTELSEAINSMYRWYQKDSECYAYLNDVGCEAVDVQNFEIAGGGIWVGDPSLRDTVELQFRSSKWFTRGWTLQELTAPRILLFVDKDWTGIFGNKHSLGSLLSDVTGIDEQQLHETGISRRPSVAERMSWASWRECSRAEDIAYCLLGIFKVNMPLLYGEGGEMAFRRLQLEIMKDSSDEFIFAWRPKPDRYQLPNTKSV
jgi:hypothetical protein